MRISDWSSDVCSSDLKATRPVDRFICANAALRWQDLALSRSYRAALARLAGPARAALVAQQRDWVSERDRRCAADRSFAELNDPASSVHEDRKSTRLNSSR